MNILSNVHKIINHSKNTLNLCIRAVIDTLPLCLAVIPWGILTGALAVQAGLSGWQAQCMSLFVFAGAAQLSGISMITASSSLVTIFTSTFVISARHLLYSITFRSHVAQLSTSWRVAIAFVLTDEMFAVSEAHTRKTGAFSPHYALASGFAFYIVWNVSTLFGIYAGDLSKNLDHLGLDFAIVAIFIAMTFAELRRFPVLVAVIVSGVLAVLLKPWFQDAYIIIAALIGMAAAYLTDNSELEQGVQQ